jgi:hypothetical protein
MFKLDKDNSLVFNSKDLKEVYESIVKQFGFEPDPFLDTDSRGLTWSKLYEDSNIYPDLWPLMIIRATGADPCPSPEEATYFSTSLWWENTSKSGFIIGVNPDEFDDESGDETEDLFDIIKDAQEEVNDVLEQCRLLLVGKLTEIKSKLIIDSEETKECKK